MGMRVIGLGTRAGTDDQVGLELASRLRDRSLDGEISVEIWENADAATVAAGLLELDSEVMLVDAADLELEPGQYRVFTDQEAILKTKRDAVSVHGIGLGDGLALARELGFEQTVRVFAVQPFDVSPGLGLSEEMSARIPGLARRLEEEIEWKRG